jgi:uncharacterized repeat protein (TIGR03803 family)
VPLDARRIDCTKKLLKLCLAVATNWHGGSCHFRAHTNEVKAVPFRFARAMGALLLALCGTAHAAPNETVIASFAGGPQGAYPGGGLVLGARGVLYGMLQYGGVTANSNLGKGMVYSLTPLNAAKTDWKFSIIYLFGVNANDGFYPWGSLLVGKDGKLYGTTALGGFCSTYGDGCGTVFSLSPPAAGKVLWSEKVLYRFKGKADGIEPLAGLVQDKAGNLYGTTSQGGFKNYGTVYKLSPPSGNAAGWTEQVVFTFNNPVVGANPDSPLLLDQKGNLYGTAPAGGEQSGGVVFRISPTDTLPWTAKILHEFPDDPGPARPEGGVIAGPGGTLYGTTYTKGDCQTYEFGCGQVFSLTPSDSGDVWIERKIHSFQAGAEGSFPTGRLLIDSSGTLYGTTSAADAFYGNNASNVFRLAPPAPGSESWTYRILHSFTEPGDGIYPAAGLVPDLSGNLYGTTPIGGANQYGTAFMLTGSGFKP